jgi:hypothetical protein
MVRIREGCQDCNILPFPSEISPQIYWTQLIILDQRPLATIYIRGIAFQGLLAQEQIRVLSLNDYGLNIGKQKEEPQYKQYGTTISKS